MTDWSVDAIEAFMAEAELFSELPADYRRELAETAVSRQVEAGQAIFRRGEQGDSLYVVASGQVRVSLEGPAGEEEVSQLGPGSFFGEIALLTRSHRTATITATDPATVIELPAQALSPILARVPGFRERLGRTGAKRSHESMKKLLGD